MKDQNRCDSTQTGNKNWTEKLLTRAKQEKIIESFEITAKKIEKVSTTAPELERMNTILKMKLSTAKPEHIPALKILNWLRSKFGTSAFDCFYVARFQHAKQEHIPKLQDDPLIKIEGQCINKDFDLNCSEGFTRFCEDNNLQFNDFRHGRYSTLILLSYWKYTSRSMLRGVFLNDMRPQRNNNAIISNSSMQSEFDVSDSLWTQLHCNEHLPLYQGRQSDSSVKLESDGITILNSQFNGRYFQELQKINFTQACFVLLHELESIPDLSRVQKVEENINFRQKDNSKPYKPENGKVRGKGSPKAPKVDVCTKEKEFGNPNRPRGSMAGRRGKSIKSKRFNGHHHNLENLIDTKSRRTCQYCGLIGATFECKICHVGLHYKNKRFHWSCWDSFHNQNNQYQAFHDLPHGQRKTWQSNDPQIIQVTEKTSRQSQYKKDKLKKLSNSKSPVITAAQRKKDRLKKLSDSKSPVITTKQISKNNKAKVLDSHAVTRFIMEQR